MEPVRTCLGCRGRAPASSLVRFVARDGIVVADASASLPGRGAWLHPTVECVDSSLKRRAFGRALRAGGALDTSGVKQSVLALHQSEPPHGAP
ncbi:YlxR family protein [Salinibacterium sp. GXW1014]|uniref:YlxR family protein n=1 Tax=Salinibacterium sp. GXW1014 TaxID=3377838 RepID=UPI003839EF18